MHKRLRKVEREELVLSSSSKTITKPRRQTSGSMGGASRLVVSTSRELSSFLPEAIASMSADSRQDRAQTQMSPAEHPERPLTLGFEGHSSAALATSTSPSLANNDLSSTTLTPALGRLDTGTNFHFGSGNNHNELGSFFANPPASESAAMAISQQVAASLEHLKAAFSETMQSPSLTAMAIDASPLTAPSTSTEWATSVATASASSQGEWEGVFSTLFNKGS
ncbi:hypothetical protein H4R26_005848 [Coemansia thaxteri]|uniref:Uncharacterized protein n=1 Tax=Coemansia thaxteri TaxID=2663907 RepID=A0A9W8B8J3_9FUNG|nr:hypothetical protein H4R26_005848 [Coemansia thaxteri]